MDLYDQLPRRYNISSQLQTKPVAKTLEFDHVMVGFGQEAP